MVHPMQRRTPERSPAFVHLLAILDSCPLHRSIGRRPRAGCPMCEPDLRAALDALRREVTR